MKKIAFTWGGTGGHIFPIVSVFSYLESHHKNEFEYIWIGTKNSLEQKIASENSIHFFSIFSGKSRGKLGRLSIIFSIFFIFFGILQSIFVLKKNKIQKIFSKWGYVAIPTCIAAWILRIPVILHESDAIAGKTNRIVGRFATDIFLNFPEAKKYFPKKKNIHITGPFLSPDLFIRKGRKRKKTHCVVLCGSQGSTAIFQTLLKILPEINMHFSIILGTKNMHFWKKFKKHKNVTTYDFVSQKKLGEILHTSDIAITRSSSAMFELDAFHLQLIMIPLWGLANNHQYANARAFEKKWHTLLLEKDIGNLLKKLKKYIGYKRKEEKSSFSDIPFQKILKLLK